MSQISQQSLVPRAGCSSSSKRILHWVLKKVCGCCRKICPPLITMVEVGISALMRMNWFSLSPEPPKRQQSIRLPFPCGLRRQARNVNVWSDCIYCWSCYGKLGCSMGDCSENSPCLCPREQAFFCCLGTSISGVKWGGLLFTTEAGVLRCAWWLSECPCLFFCDFPFPHLLFWARIKEEGWWPHGAVMQSARARYQNTVQLWSWDLAVAGGPGLLALMRSLTFSCHFFCSCFDSQGFVVAMPA